MHGLAGRNLPFGHPTAFPLGNVSREACLLYRASLTYSVTRMPHLAGACGEPGNDAPHWRHGRAEHLPHDS